MPTNSRDADAEIRDEHARGREDRPADAVLLADQLGQPLAGDGTHTRRHLLDDDQADGDHHHHPQQVVAVLRADRRVGGDAAGVVAGVGGDQARARGTRRRGGAGWSRLRGVAAAAVQRAARQLPSADTERNSAGVRAQASSRRPYHPQSSPRTRKLRRQPRGRTSSNTSSTVMTPCSRSSSSTTGDDRQVEVGHQPRHLFEIRVGAHGSRRRRGDLSDGGVRVGAQQVDHRIAPFSR